MQVVRAFDLGNSGSCMPVIHALASDTLTRHDKLPAALWHSPVAAH